MATIHEFFAMGGYALYVWSAYAISALVLGWMIGLSLMQASAARQRLQKLESARATGEKL